MSSTATGDRPPAPCRFLVELIKPAHYDDDGYVIQWRKAWTPSNSLACLFGLTRDLMERKVLGEDVQIEVNAYDEANTIIPVQQIIERFGRSGGHGLICLVGVQTNQYPRAMDLARQFRAADLAVAIGGFHVSGCLAMLPEVPPELVEAQELGITLFAGEAEGRLDHIYRDALNGTLRPVYNFMHELPGLDTAPIPFLPDEMVARYADELATYDAGRGCPFLCSFCTIINVQGRKSRHRSADDVERLLRLNIAQGTKRMFITDDNFARNRNWEAIFDRLIELREDKSLGLGFTMQVDTACHKIPNFIDKAARAGCSSVFIGLENINPGSLNGARKTQNRITDYRAMLQAWRRAGVVTYCGYILGFPTDTPESIERDIRIIQEELPLDMLEFFCLTPLPGSQDHKELLEKGVPLEPDLNFYDLEHTNTAHPLMSGEQWVDIYNRAWDLYFSPQHVETLLRRAVASGLHPIRIAYAVMRFHGSIRYEKVHPLQSGFFRRKIRSQRRPGLPKPNPLLFLVRRGWELLFTEIRYYLYLRRLLRLMRRIQADPAAREYTDKALSQGEDPLADISPRKKQQIGSVT